MAGVRIDFGCGECRPSSNVAFGPWCLSSLVLPQGGCASRGMGHPLRRAACTTVRSCASHYVVAHACWLLPKLCSRCANSYLAVLVPECICLQTCILWMRQLAQNLPGLSFLRKLDLALKFMRTRKSDAGHSARRNAVQGWQNFPGCFLLSHHHHVVLAVQVAA